MRPLVSPVCRALIVAAWITYFLPAWAQPSRQLIQPQVPPTAQTTLQAAREETANDVANDDADAEEKARSLYLRWLQPSTTFIPEDTTSYIAVDAGVSHAPFMPGVDLRQPMNPQNILTTQGKAKLATGGLGLPIVQRLVPAKEANDQLTRRRFGTFPDTVTIFHPDGNQDADTAPLVHMGNRSSATLRLTLRGTYRLVVEETFTQTRWLNHLSQNPDVILASQNPKAEVTNPPPAPLDLSVMAIAAGTDAERDHARKPNATLEALIATYKDDFTVAESTAAEYLLSTNLSPGKQPDPALVDAFIASIKERLMQETFIAPAKDWIDPTLTDAQIGHLTLRHHNRLEAFVSKEVRDTEMLAPAKDGLDWLAGTHPNYYWEDEIAQLQFSFQGQIAPQGVRVKVMPYRLRHFYDPRDAFELRTDPRGLVFIEWPDPGWYLIEATIDRPVQVGDYDVNRFQLWLAVEVHPKHIRNTDVPRLTQLATPQAQHLERQKHAYEIVSPFKPISQLPKGQAVRWHRGLPN